MRGKLLPLAAMALALMVAVPLGGAASTPRADLQSMKVSTSPSTAGAHAVRLTISLRYEMQCLYPGAGPLAVTFPAAVKLPKRFAAGSVKLGGKAIAATRSGRTVTVTIAPHKGVLCGTVGPGMVVLTFTPAAKVSNPAHAGSYRFQATHMKRTFRAKLAVKPAA